MNSTASDIYATVTVNYSHPDQGSFFLPPNGSRDAYGELPFAGLDKAVEFARDQVARQMAGDFPNLPVPERNGHWAVLVTMPEYDSEHGPLRYSREVASLWPVADMETFSERRMNKRYFCVDCTFHARGGGMTAEGEALEPWFTTDHSPDNLDQSIAVSLPYWLVPVSVSEIKELYWLDLETGTVNSLEALVHPVMPACEKGGQRWTSHAWLPAPSYRGQNLVASFPWLVQQEPLQQRACCEQCGKVRDMYGEADGTVRTGYHEASNQTMLWSNERMERLGVRDSGRYFSAVL